MALKTLEFRLKNHFDELNPEFRLFLALRFIWISSFLDAFVFFVSSSCNCNIYTFYALFELSGSGTPFG